MHFAIGTTNIPKSEAIEHVLTSSPYTQWATFSNHRVESWVPDQPTTLEEIRRGAKNRAKNSRGENPSAEYLVGMEGGVYRDFEWENYWLIGVVYIEDAKWEWHFDYSCHLEVPEIVAEKLFDGQNKTLNEVMTSLGEDENGSQMWWSFAAFSDGMISRRDSFVQATECAIAPFFNRFYKE